MKRELESIAGGAKYLVTCDGDHGGCPRALVVQEPYEDASRTSTVLDEEGWESDDPAYYCPEHADTPSVARTFDDLSFEWERDKVDERLGRPLEVGESFMLEPGNGSSFYFEVEGVYDDRYEVRLEGIDPPDPPSRPTTFREDDDRGDGPDGIPTAKWHD